MIPGPARQLLPGLICCRSFFLIRATSCQAPQLIHLAISPLRPFCGPLLPLPRC